MKDIRLYIANRRVDIPDGISLPITYQTEDFNNPTIVKNSFSKTIALPGTKTNNTTFGEIYKLDRMQHYEEWTGNPELNGINYDPSKRVDFQIFSDGELIESGYMQLNNISLDDQNVTYNITLYGGIGDFFYGLKYNEDGTTKTLADLRFFIEDDNGNVLPEETEMDFIINKDIVYKCYNQICNEDGRTLTDFMTFMPSYNGLYEDFDTSKCLVNAAWMTSDVFPETVTEEGVTYTTKNGLSLAKLNKDYTEWEIGDLRSYKQRPALKMNRLIETICREENSGYDVQFDSSFFNVRNPYWSKTYLALPLLTSNEVGDESYELDTVTQQDTQSYKFGFVNSVKTPVSNGLIKINGQDVTTDADGVITINAPAGSKVNLTVDFQLFADVSGATEDILYQKVRRSQYAYYLQYIVNYLSVVDVDSGNELGFSSAYQFEDEPYYIGGNQFICTPTNGAAVSPIDGNFVKRTNGHYYFKADSGGNTWRLVVNDCPVTNRIKIYLKTEVYQNSNQLMPAESYVFRVSANSFTYSYYEMAGYSAIDSASGSIVLSDTVSSNRHITKDLFLKTEKTPADFLLDYTKLFGLYFIKDIDSKTIHIYSRNNFFTGKVNDWSDRIDYSKNITVTPILFDKKYYSMVLDTPDTKYSNRYRSHYSQEYGQQRMATGYNFNYETNNLYSDNIYQSIVPALHSDRYFRNFYDGAGYPLPAFLNDNCTWSLYSSTDEEYETDIYGARTIDTSRTVEWNEKGKDFWPKSCFFTVDGSDESLQEISYSILMYNGKKWSSDSTGLTKVWWITDDLPIMYTLNNEPCYIYTTSQYDGTNVNVIAKPCYGLPQFINCLYDSSNNVTASLDFGLPKEIYIGNYAYQDSVTIYYNFWRKFYNDQFNIDTKKVTCYVKLDYMNQERLRDFYYFDNALWVLNKVDSYDINSDATVRCEFIKCQDINNYTKGQKTY